MCVILDTNRFSDALSTPPKADYVPLVRWLLEGSGFAVFGGSKYAEEIRKHAQAQRFFAALVRAGRARRIPMADVDREAASLEASDVCVSDDHHLLALARSAGARVICTEDTDLMQDVKNPALLNKPRGRVYRRAGHTELLHHDRGCQKPQTRA